MCIDLINKLDAFLLQEESINIKYVTSGFTSRSARRSVIKKMENLLNIRRKSGWNSVNYNR